MCGRGSVSLFSCIGGWYFCCGTFTHRDTGHALAYRYDYSHLDPLVYLAQTEADSPPSEWSAHSIAYAHYLSKAARPTDYATWLAKNATSDVGSIVQIKGINGSTGYAIGDILSHKSISLFAIWEPGHYSLTHLNSGVAIIQNEKRTPLKNLAKAIMLDSNTKLLSTAQTVDEIRASINPTLLAVMSSMTPWSDFNLPKRIK